MATAPTAEGAIAAAVCLCALPHVQCASVPIGDYGSAAAGWAEAAAAQQAVTSRFTNTCQSVNCVRRQQHLNSHVATYLK